MVGQATKRLSGLGRPWEVGTPDLPSPLRRKIYEF